MDGRPTDCQSVDFILCWPSNYLQGVAFLDEDGQAALAGATSVLLWKKFDPRQDRARRCLPNIFNQFLIRGLQPCFMVVVKSSFLKRSMASG